MMGNATKITISERKSKLFEVCRTVLFHFMQKNMDSSGGRSASNKLDAGRKHLQSARCLGFKLCCTRPTKPWTTLLHIGASAVSRYFEHFVVFWYAWSEYEWKSRGKKCFNPKP